MGLSFSHDIGVILSGREGYFDSGVECIANSGTASAKRFPLFRIFPIGIFIEYVLDPLICDPFIFFFPVGIGFSHEECYDSAINAVAIINRAYSTLEGIEWLISIVQRIQVQEHRGHKLVAMV